MWAKLTSIDLIPPFKSKDIGSAKLGFSASKRLKEMAVTFEDYQKFITQRRFGKVALCNFQETVIQEVFPFADDIRD